MIELNKKDKAILQKALDDNSFVLMQQVASELLAMWASGPVVQETEFKTVAEAIGRDERKRALTVFLTELEKLAFSGHEQ